MDNIIAWTVNPKDSINSVHLWPNIKLAKYKDYYITNDTIPGFNFLYIYLPCNAHFIIYNYLNLVLFDSSMPEDKQLFTIVSNDNGYLILRKKDVYNTYHPVTFKITIYND